MDAIFEFSERLAPVRHLQLLFTSLYEKSSKFRHPREIQATIAPEKDATRRVTDKEYEKLAAFRYNLRPFLRFSKVAARSTGLTSQQHQALLAIKGFPDGKAITIGELAEQLPVAHHSAVELTDRLALLDLVFREASTMDRRHVFIKVTDRGVEILSLCG